MTDSEYEHLANDPKWRNLDRSVFAEGTLLRYIITAVKNNDPKYNQFLLFSCIRDSVFLVPCKLKSEDDPVVKGNLIPADLTNAAGTKYLPIFSSEAQTGGKFDDFPHHVAMSFDDCVDIARQVGMDIVMDAFTGQLTIPMSLAEKILTIPTRIKEDA